MRSEVVKLATRSALAGNELAGFYVACRVMALR